jgi:hypothetical protein
MSKTQSEAGTSPPATPQESDAECSDEPVENAPGTNKEPTHSAAKVHKESSIRRVCQ